ncbi:MAG: TOBE domain-containing protein, partial [Deltaproteobacteria bacterium]|nr:TOBE domain-containing protein [Deltaproteobacteria bacterium]
FLTGTEGDVSATGTIQLVEYLGSELYIYIKLASGKDILVKAPGNSQFKSGEKIDLSIVAEHAHFFDKDGLRLSLFDEGR